MKPALCITQKEAQARPLLLDIWKFYRAERLYLLQVLLLQAALYFCIRVFVFANYQVLKDIITFFNDKSSPNQGVFESVLDILEVKL